MRLSSLFNRSAPSHTTARGGVLPRRTAGRSGAGTRAHLPPASPVPAVLPTATPASELPTDLDARVRAIGEW